MRRRPLAPLAPRAPLALLAARAAALVLLALPAGARAQIALLSSTVRENSAAPGSRYSSSIVIANPGDRPVTVRLYQTDYSFNADGTSEFGEPGSVARSNAAWISLQSARVVIRGGAQVTVPYSVLVPPSDSLRGTYWSAVMVEPVNDESARLAAEGQRGVAIGSITRYAVQVATHIQSTGTRVVRFDRAKAGRADDGAATLDVDVLDAGERGYRPTLWIEIYDAQGALRAKARQARGLLFPGTSLHQHFALGALPAGTYKAVLFADTGDDAVFASQYTIEY
jgi:hypothetical protein